MAKVMDKNAVSKEVQVTYKLRRLVDAVKVTEAFECTDKDGAKTSSSDGYAVLDGDGFTTAMDKEQFEAQYKRAEGRNG